MGGVARAAAALGREGGHWVPRGMKGRGGMSSGSFQVKVLYAHGFQQHEFSRIENSYVYDYVFVHY